MTTTGYNAPTLAEDLCDGASQIGAFIGKTERQALHLCATRQIPAFKEGGKWRMRKSRYVRQVEDLEEAALEAQRDGLYREPGQDRPAASPKGEELTSHP